MVAPSSPRGSPGTRLPLRERLARFLLFLYKKFISPLLHTAALGQCRFLPTCSEYAYGAVVRHGFFRGGALAMWRLLRCHPFAAGGLDPVPPVRNGRQPPPPKEQAG